MACKQAAMSWIFNGAGSFEKLPVQEAGPRTCHSERSEESQNECAEAKHIKIQDFSYLTTFHCNSIFALLLAFPKSLNFLLSPQTLQVSPIVTGHRALCLSSFRIIIMFCPYYRCIFRINPAPAKHFVTEFLYTKSIYHIFAK